MPIKFLKHESRQYYTAKWDGIIYDSEPIPSYEKFYTDFEKSNDWNPELPELVNLIDADLSYISQAGLKKLADWGEALHRRHKILEKKTAILLLPKDSSVPALFYELLSNNSPEHIRIFRKRDEAIDWLIQQKETNHETSKVLI